MKSDKLVKGNSRKAEKYRGPECLNCGHPLELSDRYCSYCSQLNTSKQLALKDFFGEFISSVLTYDSRLRYTIKDLLFKPGTISKNYVKGQRLKYANPFRFFLSVSIIYFLINSLIATFSDTGSPILKLNGDNFSPKTTLNSDNEKAINAVNETLKKNDLAPIVLDSLLVNSAMDSLESKLEKRLEKTTNDSVKNSSKQISKLEKFADSWQEYISEEHLDTLGKAKQFLRRFTLYRSFYKQHKIKSPEIALDSLNHENTGINRWIYDKNNSIERIEENPFGFLNYLMGKIPFFLFFFAPLFALFFWLIYSKKKNTYMEHLVLIFHLFSFLFLGLLICLIPDTLIGTEFFSAILVLIIGPFYFYKSLRNFYNQSRLTTIFKFVLLNIIFWISSTVGAFIFFAITAAAY